MSEVLNAPPLVERKCRIEDLFDANFIELIQLVPMNPFVRALILKLAGKLPGTECETFDQLKEWVETNCEKRLRPLANRNGPHSLDEGISISVEFADTEYGRADYSVPRSGTGEFRVGAEDLLEIVQEVIEAGGGWDEVVDSIAGRIDDDAWNQCDPDLDNYGDYHYSEHESSDSSDSETTYARNDIRTAVRTFLQERHPELAAEL